MKSITYFILLILIVSISTDTQTCEGSTPSEDNCKAYTSLTKKSIHEKKDLDINDLLTILSNKIQ